MKIIWQASLCKSYLEFCKELDSLCSGLLDNFGSSVLIVGELCNRLIFSSLFEDLGSFMISKLEPLKTVFVSSL